MAGKKKNNIIMQGSILAVASILARLIGIAYRIPMSNMLGEEGNGIYSVAFNIYNTALIISSYSIPLAVSKLISARGVKREHRNSFRIFRNSLIFSAISGFIVCLAVFLGADFFEVLYKRDGLARPLKVLAPTLLVVAVLGVFRGYFQGKNTMVPTAVSQVLEQIVNAIVSVAATYGFMKAHSASVEIASYGSAGGTLGTLCGATTALVFVFFVFLLNYPSIIRRIQKDHSKYRESDSEQFRVLIMTVIPVILSQTVYQIGTTVDDGLFGNLMLLRGFSKNVVGAMQGVYNSQYILLVNVPLAVATAMATSAIPSIVASMEKGDKHEVRKKTASVIKFNMVIAIPSAVGLGVLADPILTLLFPSLTTYHDLAVGLMRAGSAAVIFFAFSTITSAVLQGLNYMRLPVRHNAVSLVIHIVLMFVLIRFTPAGAYALVIGNVTFPIVVCVLNWHSISRYAGYHQELVKTVFLPILSAAAMGVAAWGIYTLLYKVLYRNTICLFISLIAAVVIYGLLILLFKCFGEEELKNLPMGHKIHRIAVKLHLM